jgi:tripartite-type tricarboxylate transporter receptor subunit TctC
VDRLNREILTVLQQPETAKFLADQGAVRVGSSPEQFAAHMKAEFNRWGKLIRDIGLRRN